MELWLATAHIAWVLTMTYQVLTLWLERERLQQRIEKLERAK